MKDKKNFTEDEAYVVCERCERNNWDEPFFWGCPRGSCDVEDKGIITITRELKISNEKKND